MTRVALELTVQRRELKTHARSLDDRYDGDAEHSVVCDTFNDFVLVSRLRSWLAAFWVASSRSESEADHPIRTGRSCSPNGHPWSIPSRKTRCDTSSCTTCGRTAITWRRNSWWSACQRRRCRLRISISRWCGQCRRCTATRLRASDTSSPHRRTSGQPFRLPSGYASTAHRLGRTPANTYSKIPSQPPTFARVQAR